MHRISTLVALVLVGAGTATLSSQSPSAAQAERELARPAPPQCCELATKNIATGTGAWTLKLPSGSVIVPVPVVPKHPLWSNPLPGSQWIGPAANTASAGSPGGNYIYTTTVCLCPLPNGVKNVPASLTAHFWADDDVTMLVNSTPVGSHMGGWSFTTSPPAPPGKGAPAGGTAVSISTTAFHDARTRFSSSSATWRMRPHRRDSTRPSRSPVTSRTFRPADRARATTSSVGDRNRI